MIRPILRYDIEDLKRLLSIVIVLMITMTADAQSIGEGSGDDWQQLYERIYSADDAEDGNTASFEETLDHLENIAAHPLNINVATDEQLQELPFLSDAEIDAILQYIRRYGGMVTLQELQTISAISYDKRMLLRHFLYCGDREKQQKFGLLDMLKQGQHEIYYAGRIPTNQRRGDALSPDDGGYLGIPYKQQLRYTLSFRDKLRIGLVGANDSGEEFFSGNNPQGFDFYSFFLQLKRQKLTKKLTLSNLVVGRYRAAFGLGLVVNNNFSLGKSTMMSSAGRLSTGFRPYSSASDGNYFQGAAVTIGSRSRGNSFRSQTSLFASLRQIDATLTTTGGTSQTTAISTIIATGYHRTQNDIQKRNTATMTAFGANWQMSFLRFNAGITAASIHLNRQLQPDKRQAYRLFMPEGKNFLNAGLNYSYRSNKLSFQGETALAPSHQANDSLSGMSVATINVLTFRPLNDVTATLLHRYFAHDYTAIRGKTFAESTSVQDENGLFASLSWATSKTLTLSYYSDYAYFSRPKYQVSQPSHSVENVLQASWHKHEWTATLRARLKNREYDDSTKTALVWKNNLSLRLQCDYDVANGTGRGAAKRLLGLRSKLLLQYAHYDKAEAQSNGVLAMLSAGVKPWKKLSIDIATGYFCTDDYYSSISAYERGLSYSMGSSQYYGEGMRLSLLLTTTFSRSLSAALKCGTTKYFDRDVIGTSLEEIQSSLRTDIDFQLRWKL